MHWMPILEEASYKILKSEKTILRDLASKYAEIAYNQRQKEIQQRMKDINGLRQARPIVLIDEVPWHEINVDNKLTILCESEFAIEMETFFRRAILQSEYFPCDRYYMDYYPLKKSFKTTGGLSISDNILKTDENNYIVSHDYIDQLRDESDLEKYEFHKIEINPDVDEVRYAAASDVLDGILPIRLTGIELISAPWDQIPRLHGGVTTVFYDLMDRPDFMHSIIKKMTDNAISVMDQYEEQGLLDAEVTTIHCTPALSDELPAKDYTGGDYRLKDVWFRSMAQMFSDISPELHEEFDINYSKPLFERCGLGYYGCCEVLNKKIDLLKTIPNLRKIGVSSWANVTSCAEQIGKDYVYSRKPNPANVAIKADPDVIRDEVMATFVACKDNGCTWDYVLKDISTVGYDINNLKIWDQTVKETLDKCY